MLLLQFLGQNLHFAINLFVALVFGAVSWLYMDSWFSRRELKGFLKWTGYLILSVAFLVSGTIIEGLDYFQPVFGGATIYISLILKIVGFLVLASGLILDPMPKMVKNDGLMLGNKPLEAEPKTIPPVNGQFGVFGVMFTTGLQTVVVIGSALVGWLYLKRSTTGLEKHLRPVAIGFFIIALSQLIDLTSVFRTSNNPLIFNAVAAYGIIWYLHHALLLLGSILIGRWVWSYLTKRFFSQLFMVFVTITVIVFLITTFTFSFLLIRNIQTDTLNTLETATNSLKYAIDSKQQETLAGAEVISQNAQIMQSIKSKDHDSLTALTSGYLTNKKLSSVVITNSSGQVLLRAEDPSRWGDSISDDTMFQRAASGISSSSMVSKQDVIAPLLYFQSSVPVKEGGQIIGSVIVGIVADSALVDGIKKATGLDTTIYGGSTRSATTLIAPDGKSRWVGIKESNKQVQETVLKNGQTFKGAINILNQPYLAVYVPLKDVDNTVAGMLFVGRPQNYILNTASRTIELTFIITAILLTISILPAYLLAKYIAGQVR